MAPEKKRILIITPDSKLGGAERNIALIAKHMRATHQLFLATTFGTGDLLEKFRSAGHQAEEFRYFENPARIADLFEYVKTIRPEIIHSFLLRGNWIAWALTRRNPEIKWIASERGLELGRSAIKARANRFFLSKADRILAVSAAVRDILIARDGLEASKIQVMNGGIEEPDPPLPMPWPELSRPRLVTLAHLRIEKNVELSIRTLKHLRDNGVPASLTLIGDGVERPRLEALARELGVDVNFAGQVSDGRRLLSHFDLLIIPSKEEGFPNVMLEAWQAGIAVLSTDTGGAREISGSENAASLVAESDLPAEALRLLRSPDALKDLAERGKKRVRAFSIDRVVEQLSGIYHELSP